MDYFLAAAAGALVVLSMSLNSALGLRVGIFRATAINYAVGLAGALALSFVLGFSSPRGTITVPWWAWTGGLLGVGIVAASNLVLPRLSVASATILVITGQLGTGLVLDALREGSVHLPRLAGAALLIAGLLITLNSKTSQAKSPLTSEAMSAGSKPRSVDVDRRLV